MNRLPRRLERIPSSATVRIADTVASLRRRGISVIDLSAGRAAEHTPTYIRDAAKRALDAGDTHQTMARGAPSYREACAAKLLRDNCIDADPETEIVATMGVKQGLMLALLASIDPGDEVIVEDPCFVSYEPLIRLAGGMPVRVTLEATNAYRWTTPQLEAAITSRTRAILFNSPHNPTGVVHSEADLDVVARLAIKHDLVVITDEVYERVTWGGRHHVSMASRRAMRERTVTTMGLTKTFSMGGWRIGFVHAAPERVAAMTVLQQHLITCSSSFAQAGAAAALSEKARPEVVDLWQDWGRRCAFVAEHLATIPGLYCSPPQGGFYAWVDVRGGGWNAEELAERLLREHHVAVVPGAPFGKAGEGHLRLTCVQSWTDIREAVDRIGRALHVDAARTSVALEA